MILLEKSWHSKLYKLTYGKYSYLPTNLCPYFWKIILASILFIPFTAICLPVILFEKIIKNDAPLIDDGYLDSPIIFVSFGVDIGLLLVTCMIAIWFVQSDALIAGAGVGYFIILAIGVVKLIELLKRNKKNSTLQIEETPNIFVEFIKAKYNRYCPKIDWKK